MSKPLTEAGQRVSDSRVRLVLTHPWWASLILRLEPVELSAEEMTKLCGMPTAATDGKRIIYCSEFLETINNDQLDGLQLHEALHCGFLHHLRRGERDEKKWNVAGDCAINGILHADGVTLPPEGIYIKKYEGWATEEIYDDLKDCEMPKWGAVLDGDGEGASEQEWKEAMTQALHQAKQAGRLPGSADRLLDELNAPPKLAWKEMLKHLVIQAMGKDDYTWKRPSRRGIACGMYLPSMDGVECKPLGFAIDTSGSMTEQIITECIREVRGCIGEMSPANSVIIEADADVQHVVEIERYDEYAPRSVKGGGGTAFEPAIKYAETKNLAVLIYFTDLEGSFGAEPGIPVIWVTDNKNAEPPFGDKILIDD